jgi:ABC-type uncharacterized transport system permease subunit
MKVVTRQIAGLGVPVLVAVLAAVALFLIGGTDPLTGVRRLFDGSLGTKAKLGDTLAVWVPLALAAASLSVTFSAGLWNIGVEGQIVLGAIGATWASRTLGGPSWVVVTAAIACAALAGALWGLLAGALREWGGVHEIFAGLGLDFVATGLTIYLVIGPWKRPGVASTSGTDVFRREAWFPEWGVIRVSPLSLAIAIGAVAVTAIALSSTYAGLRLRAVGHSAPAAARLGVPVKGYVLGAFGAGGALAGLAGVVQSNEFHHKLVPSISGGYGFLGILLVLLAVHRLPIAAAIALFFAAIGVGAFQLELRENVDSSLAGVLQALVVLVVVLGRGVAGAGRKTVVEE